ncbi:hypothetical protein GGR51DRAFT_540459 [Nemania sp. FL0031]|nr:hypothetical protein GGR51DRAFT_540459 [Nemania sp. FL0031]
MQHQRPKKLAPDSMLGRFALGCFAATQFIAPLVAIFYGWVTGLSLYVGVSFPSALIVTLEEDGPRIWGRAGRSKNEDLEMQRTPKENHLGEGCVPYSSSSAYAYCPIDSLSTAYDSPPPYDSLPATNTSFLTGHIATTTDTTSATHHSTNSQPVKL